MKECCRTCQALNPRPPDHQLDMHQTEPLWPAMDSESSCLLVYLNKRNLPIGIAEDEVVPLMIGIVTVAVDNETVTVDKEELIGAPLLAFAANVWWCITGVTGCDITTFGCDVILSPWFTCSFAGWKVVTGLPAISPVLEACRVIWMLGVVLVVAMVWSERLCLEENSDKISKNQSFNLICLLIILQELEESK